MSRTLLTGNRITLLEFEMKKNDPNMAKRSDEPKIAETEK